MSEVVKIQKIVIKVGKNEFTLTLDEAKDLQEVLNKTFNSSSVYSSYPCWNYIVGNLT